MAWKSSTDRYGAIAIAVHWVSAAAILALFALGFLAANTADPGVKAALLRGHVPLGILALVLTVFRIGWWFVDRRPAQLAGMPRWQAASERIVRTLLYVLILVMGASGIGVMLLSGAGAILFFGSPKPLPDFWNYVPMNAHFAGAIALLALAGLHILAALYHQFYKHDRLLGRMWTGSVPARR
ncbi:MAG TPA: cytochrome b/b6 domain-containing protein [Stellaceae bacterium]|jgi:cytochrome b561|nr:cytochrome b/b6 domain-containing protein [Stellaceae bacterium]